MLAEFAHGISYENIEWRTGWQRTLLGQEMKAFQVEVWTERNVRMERLSMYVCTLVEVEVEASRAALSSPEPAMRIAVDRV